MITLDSSQGAIVAASRQQIKWLFEITVDNSVVYYWSIDDVSYDGQDYDFMIDPGSFHGVTLNSAKADLGIQAPNDVNLTVINDGNTYTPSDFLDADVLIKKVISDYTSEDVICQWLFTVESCDGAEQTIQFQCVDWLQRYLNGSFPKTPLVKELSPFDAFAKDDGMCVPLPVGKSYVPKRPIWLSGDEGSSGLTAGLYYLLGPSEYTYTIFKVRSPRDWPSSQVWNSTDTSSTGYDMDQYTVTLADGNTYKVFQPIIDNDGTTAGFWPEGDYFHDMPAEVERSDTASSTNPADAWEFFLEELGIPSAKLDTASGGSFDTCRDTWDSSAWNLEWNGEFWYKMAVPEAIAMLSRMSGAVLQVTDKLELHILNASSVETITGDDILSETVDAEGQEGGGSTFRYTPITVDTSDSAYVAWAAAGEPQDELRTALVPFKSTTDNPANDVIEMPFVSFQSTAKRLSIMQFQRKYLPLAQATFTGMPNLVPWQPDDVVTINDADYGGTYSPSLDSVVHHIDGTIGITAIRYSAALDDFENISPSADTFLTPNPTGGWQYVVAGSDTTPDSGVNPNLLPGRLWIGDNAILLDPDNATTAIRVYTGAGIQLDAGGDVILVGHNSDPAYIKFSGSSYYSLLGVNGSGAVIALGPDQEDTSTFNVGYYITGGGALERRYSQVNIKACDVFHLEAEESGNQFIKTYVWGTVTGDVRSLYLGANADNNSFDYLSLISIVSDGSSPYDSHITFKTMNTERLAIDEDGAIKMSFATENLEIIDAGRTGATESGWIEVNIGDSVNYYIRAYAAK